MADTAWGTRRRMRSKVTALVAAAAIIWGKSDAMGSNCREKYAIGRTQEAQACPTMPKQPHEFHGGIDKEVCQK